jgi:ABC-type Na+ efflux pump permease subunit
MRGFVPMLRLELKLQARSFIVPATVVGTALICGVVLVLPSRPLEPRLTAFFVFMDPATIGLSFVGAMVLAEKAQGTLAALGVTPLRPAAYVGARTAALTLLTLASSLVVVYVASGGAFDPLRQLPALALCSAVAVLIGLFCVARAASMNQLVVKLLWVTTLLYVPLLAHFGVLPQPLATVLAPIPSYAMLTALTASVDPGSVSGTAQAASALYLVAWIWMGWRWSVRAFERVIVTEGR